MRAIKFRGQDVESGEWIYGDLIQRLGYYPAILATYPTDEGKVGYAERAVKEETVGQLTTLKDKNGREIYEGDILRSDDYPFFDESEDNYMGIVFCDTSDTIGEFKVMLFVLNSSERRGISNFTPKNFYDLNMRKVEVVGNIFDNKGMFRDSDEEIMKWYLED